MTAFDCHYGGLCNTVDRHEHDYFHFLVDLTDAVIATRDIPSLAEKTADYLHAFFGLDFISLETVESSTFRLNAHSFTFDRQNRRTCSCYSKSLHATLLGTALRNHEKILFNRKAMLEHAGKYPFIDTLVKKGLQVLLHLPLVSAGELLGALAIGSVRHSHFTPDVMELLNRVSSMLAMAIDVILLHGNGNSCSALPLPADSSPVEQDASLHPHNIIGNSPAIQSILRQIEIVAPCNATVLLQGETGTGKGLVAQTIHDLSERNMHEMVKMNCTAIPSELMESELFGHEKGAFTGALNRRIGHFEQADKSTLFLDEIGDMPLDLQPKLLSVLQEHQIRRLGSVVTLPVDVRFIAATNCNLAQKIEDKTFRSDLFYRLNVFPITIPPLRERAEDIPLLARFFVRKYARQMNRHITTIPVTDTGHDEPAALARQYTRIGKRHGTGGDSDRQQYGVKSHSRIAVRFHDPYFSGHRPNTGTHSHSRPGHTADGQKRDHPGTSRNRRTDRRQVRRRRPAWAETDDIAGTYQAFGYRRRRFPWGKEEMPSTVTETA